MKPFVTGALLFLSALVLSGCAGCYCQTNVWQDPNGTYTRSTIWYKTSKPKIQAFYMNDWKSIGYIGGKKPETFYLHDAETSFRVFVGQPENFNGHVDRVDVYLGNNGPLEASLNGGYAYFKVATFNPSIYGLAGPEFTGIVPGQYFCSAEIYWVAETGPHYIGPNDPLIMDRVFTTLVNSPNYTHSR